MRLSIALVVGILSLSTLVLAAARPLTYSNDAIKAYNAGVADHQAGRYADAAAKFGTATQYDSTFAEAYFARAVCFHQLQSNYQALTDVNAALRAKPDYLEPYALRGVLEYESNEFDAALTDFNYVLSQNPSEAQSLLGRGVISLQRDNVAGAEKDFRKFLKLRPKDPLAPKIREVLAGISSNPVEETAEVPAARSEPTSELKKTTPVAQRHISPGARKAAQSLLQINVPEDTTVQRMQRGERIQETGAGPR